MNLRTWLSQQVEWHCGNCGSPPDTHKRYAGNYGTCMRYRPAPTSHHDGTDIWLYRLLRWAIGDTYQPELEGEVWIVPKKGDSHPDHWPQVTVNLLDGGHIMTSESITTPEQARRLAAMLLDAADKADRLADIQEQSRIRWEGM